jgi:esterase/lipase superfamily enzyme
MIEKRSKYDWFDPMFVVIGIIVLALCGIAALFGYVTEHSMTSRYKPFAGVTLQDDTVYVTNRVRKSVDRISEPAHLRLLTQTAGGIELKSEFGKHLKPSQEVTLLIHGFSAPEKELVPYFFDVVAALKTAQYAGTTIVYDWPSTATRFDIGVDTELRALNSSGQYRGGSAHLFRAREIGWEAGMYAADREKAQREGAPGLVRLIALVREHIRPARINIVAHSMGSYVLMEAIRKNPEPMKGMYRIILLAPDLPISALEEPRAKDVIASTTYWHVYHSRNDSILRLAELANRQQSLGREGPPPASLLGNIFAHDMTEKLGENDVHGRYLRAGIADAILIETVLAR